MITKKIENSKSHWAENKGSAQYALIRLNVTAEGFSEERFVSDILRPHLLNFNIYTDVRKVLTNRKLKKRGGIVGFDKFRNDVVKWVKEQPKAYHTTFIDYMVLLLIFQGSMHPLM